MLRGRPAEALNLLAAGSGVDDADPWYDGQLMVWRAFALAGLGQLDRAREEALAGARRAAAVRDAQRRRSPSPLRVMRTSGIRES